MHYRRQIFATAWLKAWVLIFLYGCQPSSINNPPPAEPSASPPPAESSSSNEEIEIAKIPEPSNSAPTIPVKPVISRTLPESIIVEPIRDPASRQIAYNTMISARAGEVDHRVAWHYRRNPAGAVVGFEFSNHGGNAILPPRRDAAKNQFYSRDYQFRFDDRARQDIYLLITDWVPSRDRQFRLSGLMHSLMHFFPRRVLPAIVNFNGQNIVTLPTGEEVEFSARTHEITAGALAEGPVDLNPDRAARKFPVVSYNGKGVVVRVDARGADPRVGTSAIIMNGAVPPNCENGAACQQCRVPARELWEQTGALRFKFASDQAFDQFLLSRCQFGLPKI